MTKSVFFLLAWALRRTCIGTMRCRHLVYIMAVLSLGCGGGSGGFSEPAFDEKADIPRFTDDPRTLLFSAAAVENPIELSESYYPLLKAIAEKLDRPVRFVPLKNNEELIQAILRGKLDFARVDPNVYFRLKDRADIELLVRPIKKEGAGSYSVIAVRNDSSLKSVRDLHGKTMAFGDAMSTYSNIIPRAMIGDSGLNLRDLSSAGMLGSMDNCAQNVLNGAYDAGAMNDDIFEKFRTRAIGLRVLARSDALPGEPIIVRSGLLTELKDDLRRALLSVRDPDILHLISPEQEAFIPAKDADYDRYRKYE